MKLALRVDGFNARASRMRGERTRENAIRAALDILAEQERGRSRASPEDVPPETLPPQARS